MNRALPPAAMRAESPAALSAMTLAMSDMAAGRDDEAVGRLELVSVERGRGAAFNHPADAGVPAAGRLSRG